jgi:hypothetical protein
MIYVEHSQVWCEESHNNIPHGLCYFGIYIIF